MCSELLRIPYTWGGVPIFGVGVLLAIWVVVAIISLFSLLRRQGWSSETFSSLVVFLLVGAAILYFPRLFPDSFPVRGYGLMLLAGISAGVGMAIYRGRQGGLEAEAIISIGVWMVICGVIGARLFYVVEYWEQNFAGLTLWQTIQEVVNVPEGGLVIFGGFIGAAIGFVWIVRKQRLPLLAMADLAAPSMAVGLALGRIGCLLNGCCYGGPTSLPWQVTFPKFSSPYEAEKSNDFQRFSPPYFDQASHGEMYGFRIEQRQREPALVIRVDEGSEAANAGLQPNDAIAAINGQPVTSAAGARDRLFRLLLAQTPLQLDLRSGKTIAIPAVQPPPRSRPIHPTQVYSAIDAGLLGWLLWAYFPFRRRDGECIALLLTIHPVSRFLLEIIRTDEPAVFGTGLSISQNISVGLLACGLALWWYLARQPRRVTWPLVPVAERSKHSTRPESRR